MPDPFDDVYEWKAKRPDAFGLGCMVRRGRGATADEVMALMRPYPADRKRIWPDHRDVGNLRNDRADLIEPINPA